MGQGHEEEVWRTGDPLLVEGDDLVDDLDRGAALALRLADLLRVAALVGAEEQNVQHGCCVSDEEWRGYWGELSRGGHGTEKASVSASERDRRAGDCLRRLCRKKVDLLSRSLAYPFLYATALCYSSLLTAPFPLYYSDSLSYAVEEPVF